MKLFVVLGYDEDWYTFETFLRVFSTREKAKEFIKSDYEDGIDGKYSIHQKYEIHEITVDKNFAW